MLKKPTIYVLSLMFLIGNSVFSNSRNKSSLEIDGKCYSVPPPINDICTSATDLGVLECQAVYSEQANPEATPDPEATGNCIDDTELGLWYTFTISDPLTYSTIFFGGGVGLPGGYEIFSTTSDCSDLVYETCFTGLGGYFEPNPGTTYYVLSSGHFSISTAFGFTDLITCGSPAVSLINYANTFGLPFNLVNLNNNCYAPSDVIPCENEHVAWFAYTTGCGFSDVTIEVSENVTDFGADADEISITALDLDCSTLLADYDPNGLGYVCSGIVNGEILTLEDLPPSTTFIIAFGSGVNSMGYFDLHFDEISESGDVANDICTDAEEVFEGLNEGLNNICASNSGPPTDIVVCDSQSEATVWYQYDPGSEPQDITINILPDGIISPIIAAYDGCIDSELASDCSTSIELECINSPIMILVGSSSENEGKFNLEIIAMSSNSILTPEVSGEDICSHQEAAINIEIPGGEIVNITVGIASGSSSSISGMTNQTFNGVSTATIDDILVNDSSIPQEAIYTITISSENIGCIAGTIEYSILVFPQFIVSPLSIDECLPFLLELTVEDIITGGSPPYVSIGWYWNGVDLLSNTDDLSLDLIEAGQIVLEITDSEGCEESTTIDISVTEPITPTFDFSLEYCAAAGNTIYFPETSIEGVSGTWNQPFIDLSQITTTGYIDLIFTPDEGNCSLEALVSVLVYLGLEPEFDLPIEVCSGEGQIIFPTTDLNGINGTWANPVIDVTNLSGIQTNTFFPNSTACVTIYEYVFTIQDAIAPGFVHPNTLCRNEAPIVLSQTSAEGFEGNWDILIIDPNIVQGNSITSTWTPIAGQSPCLNETSITIQIIDPILPEFNLPNELCSTDTIFTFPQLDNQLISGEWSIPSIDPSSMTDVIQSVFISSEFCIEMYTWEITIIESLLPEFNLKTEFCALEEIYTLPLTSDNGVEGTWTIPTIDPSLYSGEEIVSEFQASSNFCIEEIEITFEIIEAQEPEFDLPTRLCWTDSNLLLPQNSLNGIEGIWEPLIIDVQANIGTTISSIFSPTDGSCSNEQMQAFEIIPPFEVDLIATDPSSCIIEDGIIQMVTSETIDLEYSIDEGTTWQSSPLFNSLSSGEYSILIRSTTFLTCLLSLETFLNSTDGPIINGVTSIDIFSCTEDNGSIVIDAEGDELEYSIDGGHTWQSQSEFNNLGEGDYIINIRKLGSDCVEEISASIDDFPPTEIIIVLTQDISDCNLDDGQIEIVAEGSGLEYSIDNGVSWSSDYIFDNLPSGEYEIVVQSTEGEDCSVTDFVELLSPNSPNIIELNSQNPTLCDTSIGRLEIEAIGTNLEYSIDGGMTWHENNVFNDLIPNEYQVIVRDSEKINCFDEEVVSIILDNEDLIESMFNITPPTLCEEGDAIIEVINSTPEIEFSIDGGATWQTANIFDNLLAGNYTLITRITSLPDCLIEQFIVIPNAECPCGDLSVVFSVNSIDCIGENSAIVELISIQGMNNPNIDIEWQNGETGMSIEGVEEGWQTVTINYDDECIWTDSVWVDLVEPIQFEWNVKDVDCREINNGEIEIINVTGGSGTYEYSLNGFNYQAENIFTELDEGTYDVYVRDDEDCLTKNVIEVFELEKIEIDLPEIVSIVKGESIVLDPGIDEARIDSFIWSPKVGILNPDNLMIEISPEESTTYTLEVYFGECFGSREITIISVTVEVIEEEINVGNVFSPDGDGVNDVLYIQGIANSTIEINDFSIYDRWGNKVFYKSLPEFNNKADGWDGQFGGKIAASGVFVYMINYIQNEKSQIKIGTITLFH